MVGMVALQPIQAFNTASADWLLAQIESLSTFRDVAQWDQIAEQEVQRIEIYLTKLAVHEAKLVQAQRQANEDRRKAPFLKRLFGSRRLVAALESAIDKATHMRQSLEKFMDALEAAIDKTPNSTEEQREMLKQLCLLKKELTQQKGEINTTMREIHAEARQHTVRVGSGPGLFLSTPTNRRLHRMSIRLEQEAALAPHEDTKAAIERQLFIVNRAIIWVERFR
jgi:chromosome segregation ATPase